MKLWQNGELRRINLLEGSVSSGKTWISLVLWAFWVKTMPIGAQYLMCAKTLKSLKRNCLLLLEELVGKANFSYSIANKEARLFGRVVFLEGVNDTRSESKIRGTTLQGAYCDELSLFPEDFWAMLLSRLRKPGAKVIATTNPDSPSHWLKEKYINRVNTLDMMDMLFLLDDNTFLPREYIENVKREYTGVYYERFILGHWALAEGLIYPMAGDAVAEPPEDEPLKYALSIDYGTENAFAALIWEYHSDGVWYAVDEYYYSGRDTGVTKTDEEYGQDIDAFTERIPDAKIKTVVDPSAASFIALLQRKKRYGVIQADNAVLDGIRDTATAMQTGRIKISPRLKNWRKEADGYAWDDSSGEDRPIKVNDHLMDSMRYFVRTFQIMARKKREVNAIENLSGLGYSWR